MTLNISITEHIEPRKSISLPSDYPSDAVLV